MNIKTLSLIVTFILVGVSVSQAPKPAVVSSVTLPTTIDADSLKRKREPDDDDYDKA